MRHPRRSSKNPVAPLLESLEARRLLTVFANGIDSENMGKGMWAWDLKLAMANTGFWPAGGSPDYAGFFNFEKNTQGMKYVITKATQTTAMFTNSAGVQNYNSTVLAAARAAGIKLLPYFYIHGVDTAGEASIFNSVMNTIGADGVVFDIEGEYANAQPNRDTAITNYFAGIGKSQAGDGSGARDNLYMAYSSFPYASHHSEVPYALLGDYCDGNMPQAYWSEWNTEPVTHHVRPSNEGQPMTPTMIVDDVNSQYSQISFDGLTSVFYNKPQSIKPIAITGMTYDAANTTTAAEITEFINAAKASTEVPFTGPAGTNTFVTGYRSINFFDERVTSAAERTAMASAVVGLAPGVPTSPSPANGGSVPNGVGVVFNWADVLNVYTPGAQTGGATSYAVYIDNMSTPVATVQVTGHAAGIDYSKWTSPSTLSLGAHTWKIVAKNDMGSTSSAVWSFTVAGSLPGVPSNPTPADGGFATSSPVVFDWADTPGATSYDLYAGSNPNPVYADLTSSQSPATSVVDGARTWRVVAKNSGGSTTGPTWSFTMDATAPAASYGAQTPTEGSAFLDFTVTYTDATSGVFVASIDNSDVSVTRPDGLTIAASLVSVDVNANGPTRIATYRIAAPGGTWDWSDSETYTVKQNASQVRDVAGTFRAAGTIGSFVVNFAQPFAYKVGSVLHVDFDGTATPIALSYAGGSFAATRSGTTLDFTGVTAVDVSGTASADFLEVGGAVPVPMTFANQAGGDKLTVTAGTYTFDTDFNPTLRNIDVTVAASASAIFATTLHFDTLTLDGSASMTANGANVLVVQELIMPAAGRLNLSDNDMVIDYADTSPIGGFDGTAYTGVSGLIQSGYNYGAWDGNGLRTTQGDAAGGITTLGIAEAANAFGLGSTDTAQFGSEVVDGTSIVIKYTYAGDANLDGQIDAGDYGTLDYFIQTEFAFGYGNGDFNFDGFIDAGDYGTIDNSIQYQGPQL